MKTKRWILMNPGPVNVTARVRRALLEPDICHREKEFSVLLASIQKRLLKIFNVEKTHAAALFTGSGTAAVEAMLSSFAGKKCKTLVLSNGVYGERIRQILDLHGMPVRILSSGLGHFPSTGEIEKALRSDHTIRAIAMVHHETSLGMLNPIGKVARLARRYKKIFLVDAVSSLGAEKVDVKNIDYLAGSAGKCLHGYPGVSFVLVSKKEIKKNRGGIPRTLYLDLWNTLRRQEVHDTPFTPAVQLFYAFEEALKELEAQGLKNRLQLYKERSEMLGACFQKVGLRFLVEKRSRSHVLTSLWLPDGLSYGKLHDALKKHGFVIYAGQSSLAGRIFRISNLGDMPEGDIRRFNSVLRKILVGR